MLWSLGGPVVLVVIQAVITTRTLQLGGTTGPVKFMNAAQLHALDRGYTYGLLWLAGVVIVLGGGRCSSATPRSRLRTRNSQESHRRRGSVAGHKISRQQTRCPGSPRWRPPLCLSGGDPQRPAAIRSDLTAEETALSVFFPPCHASLLRGLLRRHRQRGTLLQVRRGRVRT